MTDLNFFFLYLFFNQLQRYCAFVYVLLLCVALSLSFSISVCLAMYACAVIIMRSCTNCSFYFSRFFLLCCGFVVNVKIQFWFSLLLSFSLSRLLYYRFLFLCCHLRFIGVRCLFQLKQNWKSANVRRTVIKRKCSILSKLHVYWFTKTTKLFVARKFC